MNIYRFYHILLDNVSYKAIPESEKYYSATGMGIR